MLPGRHRRRPQCSAALLDCPLFRHPPHRQKSLFSKTLRFGLRKFLCSFILAAISKPILGVNFHSSNRLLVDLFYCQILDAKTLDDDLLHRTKSLQVPDLHTIIISFPSIVGNVSGKPCPLHGVKHSIETSGHTILAKARRLDSEKHLTAKAEFRSPEKYGIIHQSNLPWASPLHMVPKPDGSWRPCGDYSRLNMVMVHDRYPLPSILDLSPRLHSCRFRLVGRHCKKTPSGSNGTVDIPQTEIIRLFGLFDYLFMSFGLMNAAQTSRGLWITFLVTFHLFSPTWMIT
jgi:hypothetical protein